MNVIDHYVMDKAKEHVQAAVDKGVEVHTVTIILDGSHGGANLDILGTTEPEDGGPYSEENHVEICVTLT
jgi:hypothetical protein